MNPKSTISPEAIEALSEAARDRHSVFCLEQLGVPHRVLNLLYNNGVQNMANLMEKTPESLMSMPNFGKSHLNALMKAISMYHTIEDL